VFVIATWNVVSLRRARILKQLREEVEKCGIDIAGIQEISFKRSGVLDTGKHEEIRSKNAADSRCSTVYDKYLRLEL
jgi:exonuclease III